MKIDYLQNLDILGFEKIASWNQKYNIIKSAYTRVTDKDTKWWVAVVKLSNNPIGYIQSYNLNSSAGSSIYAKDSIISAMGEAIERYSSVNYHVVDEIYMKRFDNKKMRFVRCGKDENCPDTFKVNHTKTAIEHSEVINLLTNEVEYIPFEFVHLGFRRKEGLLTQPISTGSAFYPNKVISIWKGICEVVERDALMRFWYSNFECFSRINLNGIRDFDIQIRIKLLQDNSIRVYLFEIASIVKIPVVLCVLKSDVFPYYVTGVSCDLNAKKAIEKSIDEAVSIRTMAKWHGPQDKKDFKDITRLEDHMFLYANWKNSPIFETLLNKYANEFKWDDLPSDYPTTNKDLKEKITLLFKPDIKILYKDLTLPDIKEMGFVTKIIIPEMIPLSQSYHVRWLDSIQSSQNINPYPQPFS